MKAVKITVIKREYDPELAEQYLTDGKEVGPCPLHEVGDCYLYTGGAEKPEGLCPWAWIDIYNGVKSLAAGATFTPWNRQDGTQILCCTDGIRPVVFRVEATEE